MEHAQGLVVSTFRKGRPLAWSILRHLDPRKGHASYANYAKVGIESTLSGSSMSCSVSKGASQRELSRHSMIHVVDLVITISRPADVAVSLTLMPYWQRAWYCTSNYHPSSTLYVKESLHSIERALDLTCG